MGQQQLLLLVLSTVIVGLATVGGIQAFSENQAQATQDALVQRAMNIGNDVLAAHNEPSQFGGIDLVNGSPGTGDIATAAGYDSATPSADGAGDRASCELTFSSPVVTVTCTDDGNGSNGLSNSTSNEAVTVTVDPTASSEPVTTSTINGS